MDEWERERWRGEIDSELKTIKQKLRDMDGDITTVERANRDLELKVQTLATKLALYSALGAFGGGGFMSIIVGFFFKH